LPYRLSLASIVPAVLYSGWKLLPAKKRRKQLPEENMRGGVSTPAGIQEIDIPFLWKRAVTTKTQRAQRSLDESPVDQSPEAIFQNRNIEVD
jgi:hypothetical protein